MIKNLVLFWLAADLLLVTSTSPPQRLFCPSPNSGSNYLWNNPALALPRTPCNNIAPYAPCNAAQNPLRPACPNFSANELNRLLYSKILGNPALNSLLPNADDFQQNAVQCSPQSLNEPHVTNNYIIVPTELFQCESSQQESRKRRQYSPQNCERKGRKRNANGEERSGNGDTDQGKPKRRQRHRKHDTSLHDDETSEKPKALRRRKRPKNETIRATNADSELLNGDNSNQTEPLEEIAVHDLNNEEQDLINLNTTENNVLNAENTQHQDSLMEPNFNANAESVQVVLKDSNSSNISTSNSSSKPDRSNDKVSQKFSKKINKTHDVRSLNPIKSKEDMLIQDFRKKFPNIPEDLIKKLIKYMRKQLRNEESPLSDAYSNYLNYPFNFEEFYQQQLANMADHIQDTRVSNSKSNKRRPNRRNRKRKSRKKKKNNDCATTVELTPAVIRKEEDNEPLTKLFTDTDNVTSVVTLSEEKTVKNNSEYHETETVQAEPIRGISGHKNVTVRSEKMPEMVLASNKTTEQHKNEHVIKIRISLDPRRNHTDDFKHDNSHTAQETNSGIESDNITTSITKLEEKQELNTTETEASRDFISAENTGKDENADDTEPTLESDLVSNLGGEEIPSGKINEINDYFPNFEADNFAYFIQDNDNELKNLQDDRYHYTTDRNIETNEPNKEQAEQERISQYFEKHAHPEKQSYDLEPRMESDYTKTYTEVEETIQRPYEKDEEVKTEFRTPPTLEVPDFETKPIRKDGTDRLVFYDPEADYTLGKYIEATDTVKTSVFSVAKPPQNKPKDNEIMKPIKNDIESVFARSKVAKYGHKGQSESRFKDIHEIDFDDDNQDKVNDSDKLAIVLAESFPW